MNVQVHAGPVTNSGRTTCDIRGKTVRRYRTFCPRPAEKVANGVPLRLTSKGSHRTA